MSGVDNDDKHLSKFDREQAWQLVCEWTRNESLRKHALAVEICVTACGEAEADRLGLAGDERAAFLNLYNHHCPAPRLRLRTPPDTRGAPLRGRPRT